MKEYNPRLKKLLLEIVDNQLTQRNPPITQKTFKRLAAAGYSPEAAKEKIAAAVAGQIYTTMRDNKAFDEAAYEKELNAIK